jgi:hypothetical protein
VVRAFDRSLGTMDALQAHERQVCILIPAKQVACIEQLSL